MKKIILFLSLCLTAANVYAGSIQLSTYYPSPFGYYERLKFNPRTSLPETCEPGTVYYLAGTGLRYCAEDTLWKSMGGGVWTQSGDLIYPADTATNPNLKVGIGTTTPEFKLTVDNDGGILAKGTILSGTTLTTSGAGARLIWYPRKGAFRAGNAQSTEWDDVNIGDASVAMGDGTRASGLISTALGRNTTASGISSTAMGNETTANSEHSTAMGHKTTASGFSSTAMGDNTIASNLSSTAMGNATTASGRYSVAMGLFTTSQAAASTVLGRYNIISGDPILWIDTDPLFVIGNGTDDANRTNAMTVFKNGNVGIGTTNPGVRRLHVSTSGDANALVVEDSSGNVGIGTMNPEATLQLNGTAKIFGSWVTRVDNTVYQAPTDGFVVAVSGSNGSIYGYTNSNNPPTTMMARNGGNAIPAGSITFPVRKNDYWMTSGASDVYWLPLGN